MAGKNYQIDNLNKYRSFSQQVNCDSESQNVVLLEDQTLISSSPQRSSNATAQLTPKPSSSANLLKVSSHKSDPYKLVHGISEDSSEMDESESESLPLTCGQRPNDQTIYETNAFTVSAAQNRNEEELDSNNNRTNDLQVLSPERSNYISPSHSHHNLENSQHDPILQQLRQMQNTSSSPWNLKNIHNQLLNQEQTQRNRNYLSPNNPTLMSMGKNIVVLIRFAREDAKKILSNPMLINKLIMNSIFNNIVIKDIRINKLKNLIAVETDKPITNMDAQLMTNTTKLGEYDIICDIPNSDR